MKYSYQSKNVNNYDVTYVNLNNKWMLILERSFCCSNHIWKGHDSISKVEKPNPNVHFQIPISIYILIIGYYCLEKILVNDNTLLVMVIYRYLSITLEPLWHYGTQTIIFESCIKKCARTLF